MFWQSSAKPVSLLVSDWCGCHLRVWHPCCENGKYLSTHRSATLKMRCGEVHCRHFFIYLEAVESDCTIDQQKLGLKTKVQYFSNFKGILSRYQYAICLLHKQGCAVTHKHAKDFLFSLTKYCCMLYNIAMCHWRLLDISENTLQSLRRHDV